MQLGLARRIDNKNGSIPKGEKDEINTFDEFLKRKMRELLAHFYKGLEDFEKIDEQKKGEEEKGDVVQ
jgi:hypothetical protein